MSSLEIEIDHRCTMYTVHLFTIFDACREVANILNLGSLTIYREPGCTVLLLCVTSLECRIRFVSTSMLEDILDLVEAIIAEYKGCRIYTHTHLNRWDCRLISGYEPTRCRRTLSLHPHLRAVHRRCNIGRSTSPTYDCILEPNALTALCDGPRHTQEMMGGILCKPDNRTSRRMLCNILH